jgi:HisA/HisF family protein
MPAFSVIPVLDLMGGQVVHGRAGERDSYRPIATPLGAADDAQGLARALLALTGANTLYVADLDAIRNTGDHAALIAALAESLQDIEIWLDSGVATPAAARDWRSRGVTPVIGSESLSRPAQWSALQPDAAGLVLSLDFGKNGLLGPGSLGQSPALWPDRIVVMSLGRVGMQAGPDLSRLAETAARAGRKRLVYAAGGIRNLADLQAAAECGAAGALLATALHDGSLPQKEIAAFLRRQRLQV